MFNEQNPTKSGETRFTTENYYGSRDQLRIDESDLIVVGDITTAIPHLNLSGSSVYSTFSLTPQRFLKGSVARDGWPLTLERQGGVVFFPSGKKQFEGVVNFGLPIPGHQYLLFLRTSPEGNSYVLLGGYAVDGAHVVSLDRDGNGLNNLSKQALLSQVEAKLSQH